VLPERGAEEINASMENKLKHKRPQKKTEIRNVQKENFIRLLLLVAGTAFPTAAPRSQTTGCEDKENKQ
jgi:hypothetical protein